MSLYNMLHGVNPLAFMLIPMLGDKHPDEYPRFRDVFLKDPEHPEHDFKIHVYTRVGGGNRGFGYGEDELEQHPEFVETYDDSFDNTYGTYVFNVPEKWKTDFDLLITGKVSETSKEYQAQVRKVFPKLKEHLDSFWGEE